MIESPTAAPAEHSSKETLSTRGKIYTIAQAVLSSLGLLSVLPVTALLFISLVVSFTGGAASFADTFAETGPILVYTWISLLLIALFAYSLLIAILRFLHKPALTLPALWKKVLVVFGGVLFVFSLGLVWIGTRGSWYSLLSSPFVVILVALPILFFIWVGARGLSSGNPYRTWGNISFNISVMMPTVITLELILFVLIFIGIGVWVGVNPDMMNELLLLQERMNQGLINPSELEGMFFDLMQNPLVAVGGILVVSGIIPLMEEFFKPMAVWFLLGKRLTPAQGFVGGLIAGACFALLETGGSIGVPTDLEWFNLLLGRTGTGLLHITLTGFVSWGLASAFYEGKWLRAIGNYLLAALIHGTWNLFALLSGIVPVLPEPESVGNLPFFLSQAGPFVLTFLALVNLTILFTVNRKLRRERMGLKPEIITA